MKTCKSIIRAFFYIIGVIFVGEALHELYHWYFCGGTFVAGLAYIYDQWKVGTTWCAINNGAGGEIIPTFSEILWDIVFITLYFRKKRIDG